MSLGRRAYNMLRGYVGREWDRIQGVERDYAERELKESMEPQAPTALPVPQQPTFTDEERARRLLGVASNATYAEVRKAYERLNHRSNPAAFPAGSEEARKAADINRRVNWAFQVLTKDADPTERRFGSLELD